MPLPGKWKETSDVFYCYMKGYIVAGQALFLPWKVKEKITPFGVNLMRSQVLYLAALKGAFVSHICWRNMHSMLG